MLKLITALLIIKIVYDMIKFYIARNMIYFGISLIVDLQLLTLIRLYWH